MTDIQKQSVRLALDAARRDLWQGDTAKHWEHQQVNYARALLVLAINLVATWIDEGAA